MFSFSYKFRPHTKVSSNGLVSVYLQVIINRKAKRYFLDISLVQTKWDEKKQRIKLKDKTSYNNNLLIDQYEAKIQEIIFKYKLKNEPITFEQFEQAFLNKTPTSNFYEFAKDFIERNENVYAKNTIRAYNGQLGKLKRFKSSFNIKDIDVVFLQDYFDHLIKSGNNKNTAYKAMAFVKVIIKQAIKEEIIEKNPFDNFTIKKIQGNRAFLAKEELEKIANFCANTKNNKLKNVCAYFLFSCYTGLRYSDIKPLKKEQIINDVIEIQMHKTQDYVRIPLNNKAKALIVDNESLYAFKVMSNQKTNQYLKEIAKILNIEKTITFHVARHTFATLAIGLEIPIEVISKILGHTDIKTTQVYSKIVDEVKLKHLSKFDSL